jgi:hypothetical protein
MGGNRKIRVPKVMVEEPEEVVENEDELGSSESEEIEEKIEEQVFVRAPVSAKERRARVTLVGCSSLTRHGRNYVHGRSFFVAGEEQISYYSSDKRFEVLVQS